MSPLEDNSADRPVEFSIAVLCYRAEDSIVPFVESLHKIMSLFQFEWELVLVANYWPDMTDSTPDVCRDLARRLSRLRILAEPKQGAMGWDMRKGLEACRGNYIGIIDGDGQFPVEAIFSCFAKIKSDDYDFVKTYRTMRGDGLYRRVISAVYNFLFRLFFPESRHLCDVNSKPKIMRREAFQQMKLLADDWFIDAEIILNCLALKLRTYEIPVSFQSMSNRKSFVKPEAIIEFTRNLISHRFSEKYRTLSGR